MAITIAVLSRLHCVKMEDSSEDEVQLRTHVGRIWPPDGDFTITENVSAFLDVPIVLAGPVNVELWEEDWPDPDDHLGTITISPDEAFQGQKVQHFTNDDAHYELWYSVIRA
jgi:hypothetical protein